MGKLIEPMVFDDTDPAHDSRAFSKARGRWQAKEWRDRWHAASARGDHQELDRLDREWERVGLP